jgi:hypothetical protein
LILKGRASKVALCVATSTRGNIIANQLSGMQGQRRLTIPPQLLKMSKTGGGLPGTAGNGQEKGHLGNDAHH